MKIKTIFSWMVVMTTLSSAFAQTDIDALRYSQLTFGGTARSNGMAGAFGAIGADFSALSNNPGGIGMYRRSELTITPTLVTQSANSTYLGNTSPNLNFGFSLNNAGLIISGKPKTDDPAEENKGWVGYTFGLGYNRTADFNGGVTISGTSYASSMTSLYLANAYGYAPGQLDPFNELMAYNTRLINLPSTAYAYRTALPLNNGIKQTLSSQSGGGSGEYVMSFGGNYENRLYLGGTIGIPTINYYATSTYTETPLKDSANGVHSFNVGNQLTTNGVGLNVKLGAIYRIFDWLRVGMAYHSPSYFAMSDVYSSSMTTQFSAGGGARDTTASGNFNYTLVTPSRVIASGALVLGQRGMVDMDIEYVNYASTHYFSNTPGALTNSNDAIQQNFTNAVNIRLGAEWRILPSVTIRGGIASYGNPYAKAAGNLNADRTSGTLGIGIRNKGVSFDLAYVATQYQERSYLYDPTVTNGSPVKNTFVNTSVMATLGLKF